MSINWITVFAQIINLLVLVYLLKRFLYQPVLEVMKKREDRIRERLEDARQRDAKAQDAQQQYQLKLEQLERQEQQLLEQARARSETKATELLTQARTNINLKKQHWSEELEREHAQFMLELQQFISKNTVQIATKMLTDIADQSLNNALLRRFMRHCTEHRDELNALLDDSDRALLVKSYLPIETDAQLQFRQWLKRDCAYGGDVKFQTDTSIGLGLQLVSQGRTLAWSIAEYCRQFEQGIDLILTESNDSSVQPQ